MAGAQGHSHGCRDFKRPAQEKVKLSTKPKRRKHCSQKLPDKSRERARVNIGLAFERWRALKTANGLKSDAEVALCLLDV